MKAMADHELLQQWIRERDALAFHALTQRHAGMVYFTARRVLGNGTEAEDVTQECFLKLAEGHLRNVTSLPGWLHTAAVRLSLNRLRSDHRRRAREEVYQAAIERLATATMDELHGFVDEALGKLAEDLRHCVVAHFLEGQTQDAIAQELGVTRWTVSRRISKGLRRLRTILLRERLPLSLAALASVLASAKADALPNVLLRKLGTISLSGPHTLSPDVLVVPNGNAIATGAASSKFLAGAIAAIGVTVLGMLIWAPSDHAPASPQAGNSVPADPGNIQNDSLVAPSNAFGDTTNPDTRTSVSINVAHSADPVPTLRTLIPADAASVEGRLTTTAGEAVPGATVSLIATGLSALEPDSSAETRARFEGEYLKLLDESEHRYTETTDQDGRFAFKRIAMAGMSEIAVASPGISSLLGDVFLEAGKPIELALETVPASLIRGRVLLPDGTPAAGALVMHTFGTYSDEPLRLLSRHNFPKANHLQWPYVEARFSNAPLRGRGDEPRIISEAIADALGAFSIWVPLNPDPAIEPGRPETLQGALWAYHSPDAYGLFMFVPLNAEREIPLRLPPCDAAVRGTVTDGNGAPAAGYEVTFKLRSEKELPTAEPVTVAITDEAGTYRIGPLDSNQQFYAHVKGPDGTLVRSTEMVAHLDAGTENVRDIQLSRPHTVRGRVESEATKIPLADIVVEARKKGSLESMKATTDEKGEFEFELCDGTGSYSFTAQPPVRIPTSTRKDNSRSTRAEIVDGENALVLIQVPETGAYRFRVTNGKSLLLDDVQTRLSYRPDEDSELLEVGHKQHKLPDGAIEISGLPFDIQFYLQISKSGYTMARLDLPPPSPDSAPPVEHVVLHGSGAIAGQVIDQEGNPFPDTLITVAILSDGLQDLSKMAVDTDESGRFEFAAVLPSGRITIRLSTFSIVPDGEKISVWSWIGEVEIVQGEVSNLGTITLVREE